LSFKKVKKLKNTAPHSPGRHRIPASLSHFAVAGRGFAPPSAAPRLESVIRLP